MDDNIIILNEQKNLLNPSFILNLEINGKVYPNMISYVYANLFKTNESYFNIIINKSLFKGKDEKNDNIDISELATNLLKSKEKFIIENTLTSLLNSTDNIAPEEQRDRLNFYILDKYLRESYPNELELDFLEVKYGKILLEFRDNYLIPYARDRVDYNAVALKEKYTNFEKNLKNYMQAKGKNVDLEKIKRELGEKEYDELLHRVWALNKIKRDAELENKNINIEKILLQENEKNNTGNTNENNTEKKIKKQKISKYSPLNPHFEMILKHGPGEIFSSIADLLYYKLCNKLFDMNYDVYREIFTKENLMKYEKSVINDNKLSPEDMLNLYNYIKNSFFENRILSSLKVYINIMMSKDIIVKKIYYIGDDKYPIESLEDIDIQYRRLSKKYLNDPSEINLNSLSEHIIKNGKNSDLYITDEVFIPRNILGQTIGNKLIYESKKDDILGFNQNTGDGFNYIGKYLQKKRYTITIEYYDQLNEIISLAINDNIISKKSINCGSENYIKEILLFINEKVKEKVKKSGQRKKIIENVFNYYCNIVNKKTNQI